MRRLILAAAMSALTMSGSVPVLAAPAPRQETGKAVAAPQQRRAVRHRSARALRARWHCMDVNRSGTVTRDEWRGRPEAFDRLDQNGDGVLTRSEYVRAVRRALRRG